ncbi:MAG: hypothetical protein IJF27_05730 [Oscillospiraceae bacterium]|nr:hypothetical protein [Oscillospiraceae bacterium]MBQ3049941.1 hypothetical protein [Oscillospiraceae bacterium]MBQ9938299.1 hypothetical protein [Oscillospiraceae bacterium]
MNLITCDNRCIHQKDGYCCLDPAHLLSSAKTDGCCYFVAADSSKTQKK